MGKLKLGIVNSAPLQVSYGGVAPFIKNLDPFLKQEYDVYYFVLPLILTRIRIIPQRLIYLVYLLGKKKQLNRCDVILSHVPEGSYVVSFGRVPFIHIFHGNYNPMTVSRYWFGKYFKWVFDRMEKRIRRKASRMYTVGTEMQGIPKIYNPVFHSVKITDPSSRSGFIFSGRLEKVKNVERSIRIYSKLPEDIQNENPFYIAGKGTLEGDLRKQAVALGLEKKVVFLGELNNDQMVETNSTKKMMIMTSLQEGMPMAIAEALSVGIPVISTDVGDIARIIQSGVNGFLLALSFEDEEYIRCIQTVLGEYKHFCENALASAEIFRSETVSAALIQEINSIKQLK